MSVALLERELNLIGGENESIITYEKLNIENEEEVIEFEKALYNEFMERNPESWVPQKYIKVENCRFKIPRDYKDIGIYIAKKNNRIIMSIGFNFDIYNTFQAEKMGFKNIYKDIETAEGLFFFSVQSELKELNFFETVENLFIMAEKDFSKKRIIKKILLTCSKRHLNLYSLLDFQTLKKITTDDGEEKYLLCLFR